MGGGVRPECRVPGAQGPGHIGEGGAPSLPLRRAGSFRCGPGSRPEPSSSRTIAWPQAGHGHSHVACREPSGWPWPSASRWLLNIGSGLTWSSLVSRRRGKQAEGTGRCGEPAWGPGALLAALFPSPPHLPHGHLRRRSWRGCGPRMTREVAPSARRFLTSSPVLGVDLPPTIPPRGAVPRSQP